MRADAILKQAHDALADRAKIRDQPAGERSAARAAEIMSAWTGHEFTESEIWMTLLAVKMARSIQGKFNPDDYIDLAGYAALLGERESQLNSAEACDGDT